jgi:hypothetical protein
MLSRLDDGLDVLLQVTPDLSLEQTQLIEPLLSERVEVRGLQRRCFA